MSKSELFCQNLPLCIFLYINANTMLFTQIGKSTYIFFFNKYRTECAIPLIMMMFMSVRVCSFQHFFFIFFFYISVRDRFRSRVGI